MTDSEPVHPSQIERHLEQVLSDADEVDGAWQAALEGEEYDIPRRIVTEDGDTRWIRELAEIEFDEDGNPVHTIGVIQDITERKEHEARIEGLHQFDSSRPALTSVMTTRPVCSTAV